jgi:hypothetical protein
MGMGGTKGWTSHSGWGCMLRTSQNLLATALGRVGGAYILPLIFGVFFSFFAFAFRFRYVFSLFSFHPPPLPRAVLASPPFL